MSRYRKRPVVIEAVQWTGKNGAEIARFLGRANWTHPPNDNLKIHTLEGTHDALEGDYIIRGVQGEFYPCKPDIFEQTYEPVDA
jgi:hypothetical protein